MNKRNLCSLDRWNQLWKGLGGFAPPGSFADLVAQYTEPHRHYHTINHIENCLINFDRWKHLAVIPNEVELALWMHDVIYEVKSRNNEERSAEYTIKLLANGGVSYAEERIVKIILATRHSEECCDDDVGLAVDIDLAILAAPMKIYSNYERQIRKEYSWVSHTDFKRGREGVLRSLLNMENIYAHQEIRDALQRKAQTNLQREISKHTAQTVNFDI